MAGVKFMVMYPRPQDIDAFEKLYQDELGLSVALVYIVILWQITEHIVKGALPH